MGCLGHGRWARLVLMALLAIPSTAPAVTKTATINFRAEVLPACSIGSTAPDDQGQFGTLNFGSYSSLSNAITIAGSVGNGSLRINCVTGTSYRVLISAGGSGNINARSMTGPGADQIAYNLYTSSSYDTVWDNSIGVQGIGNGNDQYLPVYGYVPSQTTPVPGVYNDTVIVTVSW